MTYINKRLIFMMIINNTIGILINHNQGKTTDHLEIKVKGKL